MSDRLRPAWVLAVGAGLILLALMWWYVIFGTIVSEGYGKYSQAAPCLWGTSGYTCQLMLSLCSVDYLLIPKAYHPELFQTGVLLLLSGGLFAALRRSRRM